MKRKFRILKETFNDGSIEFSIQYKMSILGIFGFWFNIGFNKVKESLMVENLYFNDLIVDAKYKFLTYKSAEEAIKWLQYDKSCSLGLDDNNQIIYIFDVKNIEKYDICKIYGSKILNDAIKIFEKFNKVDKIKVISSKEVIYV